MSSNNLLTKRKERKRSENNMRRSSLSRKDIELSNNQTNEEERKHCDNNVPGSSFSNKDSIKTYANLFKTKDISEDRPTLNEIQDSGFYSRDESCQKRIALVGISYFDFQDFYKGESYIFNGVAINYEEIYTLDKADEKFWTSKNNAKTSIKETHSFDIVRKHIDLRDKLTTARNLAANLIQNKVMVCFRSLNTIKILKAKHPVKDIRDVNCLKKFINVIDGPHLKGRKITLEDLTYYFLGEDRTQKFKTSLQITGAIERLYKRFKGQWEKDVSELVKAGNLNQILTSEDSLDYHKRYNPKVYAGLHCDVFEYSLFESPMQFGSAHFFYAVDIDWGEGANYISDYIRVTNSGLVKNKFVGPIFVNSTRYVALRRSILSDLTNNNCGYITIGHGIFPLLRRIIGENVTNYNNIHDLQLNFYLHKGEPMNNTLESLASKYLHIVAGFKPDGYARAKICMQLYKLYRFQFGIDEESYGGLVESKKHCPEN